MDDLKLTRAIAEKASSYGVTDGREPTTQDMCDFARRASVALRRAVVRLDTYGLEQVAEALGMEYR